MFARILVLAATLLVAGTTAHATPQQKEWTLLVFLNGNNNLNRYARDNLADMERVGSSDQVNVVVQWADYEYKATRRLLVTKNPDSTSDHIKSPILEELGPRVDMGDWRTLVDFIKWGVANFPAKHYFIDVWDHGTGWHDLAISDISHDELSKHWITTLELGRSLSEAAAIIGHKIDIYGSDACEMAMLEVAAEVADSVDIYAGSEADIPVDGWPYKPVLEKWEAHPEATAAQVAKIIHGEYLAYYVKLHDRHKPATFSILDLNELPAMLAAVSDLGRALTSLSEADQKKAAAALSASSGFSIDYIDLLAFTRALSQAGLQRFDSRALDALNQAAAKLIVANGATEFYSNRGASGVSIWLPPWRRIYDQYVELYRKLKFSAATRWEDAAFKLAAPETKPTRRGDLPI